MARITMEITTAQGTDPEAVQAWIGDGLAIEQGTQEEGQQQVPAASALPRFSVAAANEVPPPRRSGRRTTAEKAAEREAAERGQQPADADAARPAETAPALPQPNGGAFPPGIAPPGVVPAAAAPAQAALPPGIAAPPVQPIPAAMPRSEPLPPAENGIMRLEDFRAAHMQIQKFKPGKMNLLMKSGLWPSDNAAKESWFTIEAVPPEFRTRLIDEIDFVK